MIEASHLQKSFGDVQAVRDVSFRAPDGAITGLLGPNGAGKTTTLRMLYTLMQPDGGQMRVDGADPTEDPLAVRQRIGVLPDSRGIYERLTARENVRYYGELQGLDRDLVESRIDELARALDMGDFIDRRAQGFSQGQRVKVAIARALIHEPKNIMLDEPTNGLDVMSTRALRAFLRELRGHGRCLLFSSHIMQEVAQLCDTIVVIANGTVVASGTTDQLREQTGEADLEDAFVKAIARG